MTRDGKPKGFFFLDHRTVNAKYNIIRDSFVTPGNITDDTPYLDRVDTVIKKFNLPVKYAIADAGYATAPTIKKLSNKQYKAILGFRIGPHIRVSTVN